MNEANKIKLGGFMLISIVLLIVSFIAAGAFKFFEPRLKAMTLLNTSVEGMSVGSPVKYLGMPVGKITGMTMRGGDGYVAVYFEIFGNAIVDDIDAGDGSMIFDQRDLEKCAKTGIISCFINASGLMGGTHLELALDPKRLQPTPVPPQSRINIPAGVALVPSRPSHIGNAIQNVSRLLDNLNSADIPRFINRLESTLEGADNLINRGRLNALVEKIETISDNLAGASSRLDRLISDENTIKINRAIEGFEKGCTALHKLTSDSGLRDGAAELKQRLESTLIRLDNTLKVMSQLAVAFGDDPSQLLRGRRTSADKR